MTGWICPHGGNHESWSIPVPGGYTRCCFKCGKLDTYHVEGEQMSKDPKSTYYDAGGIETVDIIRAKLTPEQYVGYLLGNVIKYSCRINHKGTAIDDARKAAYYTKWLEGAVKSVHSAGEVG